MKTSIKFTSDMLDQLGLGRKIQARRPLKGFPLEMVQVSAGYDDSHAEKPTSDDLGYDWIDGELRFWCAEYPEEGYTPVSCPYGAKDTVLPVEDSDLCIEITKIRVERVQEITEDDARREGVARYRNGYLDYEVAGISRNNIIDSFRTLWNTIYGETEYKWDLNPWVWVIEFNVREAISLGDALDQVLDEVLSEEN